MANINLNRFYNKQNTLKSNVDSSITVNNSTTKNDFWGDIRLDLEEGEFRDTAFNSKQVSSDLQRIKNEEAVIIALRNLFNTQYGSRLLNPEMNFNLSYYIFQPINSVTAWFLGYDIMQYFPLYEPRVIINGIKVIPNVDDACYYIEMKIAIPDVSGESFKINSILNQDGFALQ